MFQNYHLKRGRCLSLVTMRASWAFLAVQATILLFLGASTSYAQYSVSERPRVGLALFNDRIAKPVGQNTMSFGADYRTTTSGEASLERRFRIGGLFKLSGYD